MQIPIITFFTAPLSLLPSPFPGPTSKTSLHWQQIQYHSSAYSKIGSAAKRGRGGEGFVSLESTKEIIFETNFARGEQNPLTMRGRGESTDRPIVGVLINFAEFFNPAGKLPLKRESLKKLFIECQNLPP